MNHPDSNPKNESSSKVLNPTLIKLGLISFFADVASEMLYPITPIFLTTVLGASATAVGIIEGTAEAMASLMKTFAGSWSDRIRKRKPFICVGYLFAALAKPLTGASGSWPQVLFARSFDRLGKGLRTAPRDALLAESVSQDQRGAAFGWHRLMDTMGAAIGPLIAILYLNYSTNLRPIYFLAFIPGILAVFISFGIAEDKVAEVKIVPPKPEWESLSKLPKNFRRYLLAWTLFSLANSSDVFLLLKVQAAGISTPKTILMYCFFNLIYALSSPSLGGLSDKIGRKNVLMGGLLFFTFVYLSFMLATSEIYFWLLFASYGLYMGATEGVGKAFAIDLLSEDRKATAVGYVGTFTGIATLFASMVGGFLWDKFGAFATFLYGAAGALICLIILFFFPVKAGKLPTN
ncbi:MAG: hypothetical protein A2X86_02045 [Bdellovibrionales bacterium GWA2_49_15]|nr:MAG: hypothetical protein A2X86_02045 [Bdellovibrionales bacterium GWA2_49_15]